MEREFSAPDIKTEKEGKWIKNLFWEKFWYLRSYWGQTETIDVGPGSTDQVTDVSTIENCLKGWSFIVETI